MFVLTIKSKISKKILKILSTGMFILFFLVLILFCVTVFDAPKGKAECNLCGEYCTQFNIDDANNAAKKFAAQFDKEIDELYSEQQVYIPTDFNDTYLSYNKLQNSQGLDLEDYKGKQCTLYNYKLDNYKIDYQDTYMILVVYKEKVIAGHISTGVFDSVMYTFCGE